MYANLTFEACFRVKAFVTVLLPAKYVLLETMFREKGAHSAQNMNFISN